MLLDAPTLVALVSSRICHDLVSPVAALTTAIDILDDEGSADMREQALTLIRTSAIQAAAKLEFLRATFGAGTTGTGDYDMTELKGLAERFVATQKPQLDWTLTVQRAPRAAARLLMNLLMVGLDCLPRGGTIEITGTHTDDQLEFKVIGTGLRAALKPAVRAGLAGEAPEDGFDGRSVQPYLAFLTATAARATLAARESEDRVELIVRMIAQKSAF
jgi:histidine phosphotransferase ChpT